MSKCIKCGQWRGVKHYIIADDIENPRPYCKKCYEQLFLDLMIALNDIKKGYQWLNLNYQKR